MEQNSHKKFNPGRDLNPEPLDWQPNTLNTRPPHIPTLQEWTGQVDNSTQALQIILHTSDIAF